MSVILLEEMLFFVVYAYGGRLRDDKVSEAYCLGLEDIDFFFPTLPIKQVNLDFLVSFILKETLS